MKKKLILVCFALTAMVLPGCKKNVKDKVVSLELSNFKYDEALPQPNFSLKKAKELEVSYSYLNAETGEEIGEYVPGQKGTIVPGKYKIKATGKAKNYKPFSVTADFEVSKAEFDSKYALSTDSINLGSTESDYNINAVNLNALLSINMAGSSTALEGTSFSWKEDYSSFVSGTPFDAVVVASKEHYVSKEYTVHVSSTKAAIAIPKLHKPGNAEDNFELDYVYNGLAQSVECVNLDSTNVEIVSTSVLEATNVGTYRVEFKLKNPNRCTWPDSTTDNKSLEWIINKAVMSDLTMVAKDYDFDELKPAPNETNVPAGTEKSYKYYELAEEKFAYVPGTANDILPGSYYLEATYTNSNYETLVKTYGFVVSDAQFDEAYSISSTSLDVGELDIGYELSDVNLNEHFQINVVATSEKLDGVTFSWKQEYEITGGTPLAAKIVAHKEGFADKEFDITVSSTKKLVNMPALHNGTTGTEPVGYLEYTGGEISVHLSGVNSDYVDVTGNAMTQTNAGTYSVTASLKDPLHTCWSDSSISDKTFEWEINPFNIAGSSDGYRLIVGGYACEDADTIPYLNEDIVETPVQLKFEFSLYNEDHAKYEWTDYEYAKFETTSEYATIDENGILEVLDTSKVIPIKATTSNTNHSFTQGYDLHFEEGKLRFHPESTIGSDGATKLKNSFWGDITTSNEDYLDRFYSGGDGLGVSLTFKAPLRVSFKFAVETESETWSINPSVFFSKNTNFTSSEGDVKISCWLDQDDYDYDNDYVTFDFSEKVFDGGDYYFQFWCSGFYYDYLQIKELIIEYNTAVL